MKKITILGFTNNGTFIAEEDPQVYRQLVFEGFKLNRNMSKRKYLQDMIGKQLEGSIHKNLKIFRYSNENFFKQLINKEVVTVCQTEIDSSKIYNSEQKLQFKKISSEISIQDKNEEGIINLVQQHQLIAKKIKKQQKIKVTTEYYAENIVVSFQDQDKKRVYLPIRLSHIKGYFKSVTNVNLGNILKKFPSFEIEVKKIYYSLQERQTIVEAIAPTEYEQQILKNGLGTMSLSSPIMLKKQLFVFYNQCLKYAQQKYLGIFERAFQMLNLIYTKDNLVGIVQDIYDDFSFEIRCRSNQQIIKFQLANIFCPIGDQPGAFQCKQFARKNLIGKQVNVFFKQRDGLRTIGSMTRIVDSKNIEHMLIQNGWGLLKQDLKSSLTASKSVKLQSAAKANHKGLHKSNLNTMRFADLTIPNLNNQQINLEKRIDFLNTCPANETGVIESIISPTVYHVRIDSKRTVIKVRLQGVITPNINELLPQYQIIEREGKKFMKQNFTKRTVLVSLVDYKKATNEFIGTIKFDEKNGKFFQEILLQKSLVFCKKDQFVSQRFLQIEEEVKKQQKGVWQPKIAQFRPRNFLSEEKQFKGKFSWIVDGEMVFIQPVKYYDELDAIWKSLNEKQLLKMPKQEIKVGALCVASYCDEFCRAQIIGVKNKKIKVVYIDWGNRETVEIDKVFKLNQDLLYVPAQCFKAHLNVVKRLKNKDCIEQIREQLLAGQQYTFKQTFQDFVDVYTGEEHINISLIQKGYIKFDRRKICSEQLHQYLFDTQKRLRMQKSGIWQYSEQQQDSEDLQQQIYLEQMIDK